MMVRWLLGMFTLISLVGCTGNGDSSKRSEEVHSWMQTNDKIRVLATTEMITDLVEKVAGNQAQVLTLIVGELDPHSYHLVKGDGELFDAAQIVFYNGLGLEHSPSILNRLQESQRKVSLGDSIAASSPQLILDYEGVTDPHIWMDISLWRKSVPYIVEAFAQIDPPHAQLYRENGEKLMEELENAHQQALSILQAIPEHKRYLVTSHDAFNYFARTYLATEQEKISGAWQDRFAAPEGLSPVSQLSTADIQIIIDHLKRFKINVLFPESNVSKASIRKILSAGEEHGLNLHIASDALYADAMGPPGSEGDTYLKMVLYNARIIASHLTKNGDKDD